MPRTYFQPRWVIGRRIVGVELNAWHPQVDRGSIDGDPYNRRYVDDRSLRLLRPVFRLDNGAVIEFLVQEDPHQGDGYGVQPIYRPPRPASVSEFA